MQNPENLIVINDTERDAIVEMLHQYDVTGGHFTNGTYMAAADIVIPTTLAGFQFVTDNHAVSNNALFIAVNSDLSMSGIMQKKNATMEERDAVENSIVRALKVGIPLAQQHPDKKIVILFYDEETPTNLYDRLAETLNMESLYKWGFGTNPAAPKIEGAHNFKTVYSFPFLNDDKAVCHDITIHEDQSDFVKVHKLHQTTPPYMTPDGKLLFPLAQPLQNYAAVQGAIQGFTPPILDR